MVSLNNGNYISSLNLFKEDLVVASSNITIDYNTYVYQTSNIYPVSNYITSNIYETSNFYSSSNYYSTSNYDYSTSNFYSTSNYFSSNFYSTSNYITSNIYNSTSNYDYSSNVFSYGLNDNPVGMIIAYSSSNAPTGYLMCYGQSISRTTYAELFNVIGTTYGSTDSNSFSLPDLRGRVIAGIDSNQGILTQGSNLGNKLGSQTHTLTTAEIPSHNHTYLGVVSEQIQRGSGGTFDPYTTTTSSTTGNTGGGLPHSNVQPTIIMNYIIKYSSVQNQFTVSNIYNITSNVYYTSNEYYTSNNITSNISITGSNVNSITNIFNPWKFKASQGSDQSLTPNNWTTLQINTIEYDLANGYNTLDYSYTVSKAGYYQLDYDIDFTSNSVINNELYEGRLLINDTIESSEVIQTSVKSGDELCISKANIEYFNSNDNVKLQARCSAGTTVKGYTGTHFNMHLLSVDILENNGTLYLNDNPIGSIIDYTGIVAPSNFLICDGSSISRTTYADLFAVIGTTYGSADSNSFNLPDLRNKYTIGASNNVGSTTGSNNLFNSNLTSTSDAFVFTTGTGYAISKSNLPPSMYLNKIIKYASVDNAITQNNFNTYNITSNLYASSNYYSSSNYSTSNYFSSNYYPSSNYFSSNYYTSNNYTSNNYTSNNYTSNNYGTDVRNVYNEYWGRAFMDATQSNLVSGVWYSLPVNQFEYQGSNSGFDLSTYTLTIQVEGVYRFSYGVEFAGGTVNDVCHTRLLKNGTEEELHKEQAVIKTGQTQDITLTDIIKLNVGDTIKLQAKVDSGTNVIDVLGNPYYLNGPDLTHVSWVLEAATGVLTNSNLYLNTSAVQSASNFTAFAGYSNSLIATNVWCKTSNVGINNSNPLYCLDLNCTGAIRLPRGTDAQRPSNADGLLRYNTTSNLFETCSNNTWQQVGSGTGSISGTYTVNGAVNVLNLNNPYQFKVLMSGTQSVTNSSNTIMQFNTKTGNFAYDPNGNFDTTNYLYRVPTKGYYSFKLAGTYVPFSDQKNVIFRILKNNTSNITEFNTTSSTTGTSYFWLGGVDAHLLDQGDVIQAQTYHTDSAAKNLDSARTYFSGFLISPFTPSNLTVNVNNQVSGYATPSILNMYNNYQFKVGIASDQSINNTTTTFVGWNSESYDLNNNFDTVNYQYTVPITGYYNMGITIGWRTFADIKGPSMRLRKNGTIDQDLGYTTSSGTGNQINMIVDNHYLNAGDTLKVDCYQDTGSAKSLGSNLSWWYGYLVSPATPSNFQFNL